MTAIDELYQFFEGKSIELDEALLEGQFYLVFDNLQEFFMVHLYRNNDPSPGTFMEKVQAIREYLHWAFARYIHQQVSDEKLVKIQANLELKLATFFQSFTPLSNFNRKNYKSLSEQEAIDLYEVVHTESTHNPFPPKHRLRNYLMIKLLLNTGIRLGELLLLKTTSLVQSNQNFYVRIIDLPGGEDTRADRPDLKNMQSERVIAITKELFNLCDLYILQLRRPIKAGKRMNLQHGFLFTSTLGKPLAKSTVSDIFQAINNKLIELNKQPSIGVSPHVLRHTFADTFLAYLIDVRHLDMARAKDELRTVCGWSMNSVMPLHYAGRYINKVANQHNLDRIATTNNFYEHQK